MSNRSDEETDDLTHADRRDLSCAWCSADWDINCIRTGAQPDGSCSITGDRASIRCSGNAAASARCRAAIGCSGDPANG